MTQQPFPKPRVKPLQRLHVYNSLMMNAERWHISQSYHSQRQNIQYQSLHEPGIVCGLGVRVINPPSEAPARFRDRRWIEIQPGIAIDIEGNPIIIDESVNRTFRISTPAPINGSSLLYVVTSYVEPPMPEKPTNSSMIREWFRLDEKTTPPGETEIELCRIHLQPGVVELENPTDVLFPTFNQLDLRYRTQAKARPQAMVSVASLPNVSDRDYANLSYLMRAVTGLYPALSGSTKISQVNLMAPFNDCDLLYLTGWQALNLDTQELETLIKYLQMGGVVLIEVGSTSTKLTRDIQNLISFQLEVQLQSWYDLNPEHPLRNQPFIFAGLPVINQQPIQLWNGSGIVLVEGDLSGAWGVDNSTRDRNEIRTAQELGINILNFAYKRRSFTQCLQ